MKDILEKISSYNLFNYLLPGVIFVVLAQRMGIITLPRADIVVLAFLYYFIGMVVSRVGSLAMEPLLKLLNVVAYAPYADYLKAYDKDAKMAGMVEANNTYRTLAATFLALLGGLILDWIADGAGLTPETREYILAAALFVLFVLSFRKQSAFIVRRVEHYKN
jgi:hypothetical protein